jgi:AraC-like DNA-binding protein
VGISPLLRELILAATAVATPYDADSRAGRLMALLLDEMHTLPVLPLHLPQPADARLQRICAGLAQRPDDPATLADWAERLGIDAKTIQRLFARETGMTFGQWRQQSRLLLGLEQLARGEKVVDVALALGYESPSAFAAMFRRQFGETPSAFFR